MDPEGILLQSPNKSDTNFDKALARTVMNNSSFA